MEREIIPLAPGKPKIVLAALADKAKETYLRQIILKIAKRFPLLLDIIRRSRMFVGGALSLKEFFFVPKHEFFRQWRNIVSLRECAECISPTTTSLAPAANCPVPNWTVFPRNSRLAITRRLNLATFPEIYSLVVDNAHIIPGSSTIIASDVMVFHDFFDAKRELAPEELARLIKFDETRRKACLRFSLEILQELPEAAHFLDAAALNYAHWITEMLPRIVMFYKVEAHQDIPILVDEKLPKTIWQSLLLAIGPLRKIYVLSPLISVKVRKLHVISVAGYIPFGFRGAIDHEMLHGRYSPVALASVRTLALETVKGSEPEQALPRKIFIRRRSGIRRLLNQDQIEKIVISKGFSIISPEDLSFLDQVRLFNQAETIIGPTGAAFANVVFCNPSTKVTILIAENADMPYLYWPKLASVAGVEVSYVFGRAEGPVTEGVHRDFRVPEETLISFFEELGPDEQ